MPYLAIAGLVATAVGAGVSAYGAYQQGQVAKSTAEYNADLMTQQAQNADLENRENMQRLATQNERTMASQRVNYAATGLEIGNGSPLQVQADTAKQLKLNMLDQNRAAQAQEQSLYAQAGATQWAGNNYAQAGMIGAGSSLLNGAASFSSQYYGMKKAGVFSSTPAASGYGY